MRNNVYQNNVHKRCVRFLKGRACGMMQELLNILISPEIIYQVDSRVKGIPRVTIGL